MNVIGFAYYGSWAASTRVRLGQYQAPLRQFGVNLEVCSLLGDWYRDRRNEGSSARALASPQLMASVMRRAVEGLQARRFDKVILSREFLPFMPALLERVFLGRPFIYDLDDARYLLYRHKGPTPRLPFMANKIDGLIQRAEAVLAGSETLATYTRRLNRATTVIPSVVDTERYWVAPQVSKNHVVIGWIGSPATEHYLRALVVPLTRLARQANIRLRVVGGRAPVIPGVITEEVKWSEVEEVSLIQAFDIGIMPLFDDAWSRGKCAFKLIQCMACGIPVVASPVGANNEVVSTQCGFLADSDSAWLDALARLAADESLRRSMGRAGRERVEQHYSLAVAAPRLAAVLRGTASGQSPSQPRGLSATSIV
jgi:glycosyltransferase involved in cell wall biosynthesis